MRGHGLIYCIYTNLMVMRGVSFLETFFFFGGGGKGGLSFHKTSSKVGVFFSNIYIAEFVSIISIL